MVNLWIDYSKINMEMVFIFQLNANLLLSGLLPVEKTTFLWLYRISSQDFSYMHDICVCPFWSQNRWIQFLELVFCRGVSYQNRINFNYFSIKRRQLTSLSMLEPCCFLLYSLCVSRINFLYLSSVCPITTAIRPAKRTTISFMAFTWNVYESYHS